MLTIIKGSQKLPFFMDFIIKREDIMTKRRGRKTKIKSRITETRSNNIILVSMILISAIIVFTVFKIAAKKQEGPQPVSTNESTIDVLPEKIEDTSLEESNQVDNEENTENDFVIPKQGLRPFAVMIDNEGTKPLPQGGLNKAQLIYEIIVEGGETRLMPVFWDVDPKMIGPVRSSRHYFLDYSREHDSVYVHFGWSPMAQKDISNFKINNINGVANGGEIFWDLTDDPYNWQDSYTSADNIVGYIAKAKYRTNTESNLVFKYNDKDIELQGVEKADKINIRYSASYTCKFEYNDQTKLYNRFRKEKPHMERVTDKQLTAKNIIIQKVQNYTIKGDTEGRQEVVTVGSGTGWFITCGKAIEIKWSKESRGARTKYTTKDGEPIILSPGQTWIQIVPMEGKVSIE